MAAQAPLLADRLRPQHLAAPLNERLGALLGERMGSEAWEAVWSPVRRGVRTLAAELIHAGVSA